MALKLKTNKAAPVNKTVNKPTTSKKAPITKTNTPSSGLLMTGGAAKEALQRERALAKQRDLDRENSVFRFYLKPEQEETITFLDGDLDEDGDLENICYYEHTINTKGYPKYVCINDPSTGVECPICATGDNPYFATVFTVLVHKEWASKQDIKDGIKHEASIQLFVAKSSVADKLRKKAKKYGGLAGVTFEVSRSNADAFNVGDDFDYVQKNTLAELVDGFPNEVDKNGNTVVKPLDYNKVLQIYSESELHDLGFGTPTQAVGGEAGLDEDDLL